MNNYSCVGGLLKGKVEVVVNDEVITTTNNTMQRHIPALLYSISGKGKMVKMGAGADDSKVNDETLTTMTSSTKMKTTIDSDTISYPVKTEEEINGSVQTVDNYDLGVVTYSASFDSVDDDVDGDNGPIYELALFSEQINTQTSKERMFARTVLPDPGVQKPSGSSVTFNWSLFYGHPDEINNL